MNHKVFDREGQSYMLSMLEREDFLLTKYTIARSSEMRKESVETLLLGDILISNDVILIPNKVGTKFRRLLSFQSKPTKYRDWGSGSALLKFLINYAREKSFQSLYGNIHQQNLQNKPKLLQWYNKHGLETQPPLRSKPNIVAVVPKKNSQTGCNRQY